MKDRNLTRILAVAVSVLMLGGVVLIGFVPLNAVFAEAPASSEAAANLFERLNLSEQQKNTIADIFGKANEEIRQVIAKASGGNHG